MNIKPRVVVILIIVTLVGGWFAVRALRLDSSALTTSQLAQATVTRGDLNVTVQADGVVQANQSAELFWQTSGTVAQVNVQPGDAVTAGQRLAHLEDTSLPQHVILAKVDLLDAQRELDNLLHSQTQRAQAMKAVEEAQLALEEALTNETSQAQALEAVAQARKAVELAELNLAVTVKQPSQQAIDQAYANLVLAENVLKQTRQQYEKIQRQLNKPPSNYQFFESKALYRGILDPLNLKLARDQRAYEQALEKYNQLLEPVDPLERMVAEGNLALRMAELDQAVSEFERAKTGPRPGVIAVLEAQLEDAQREWERWQEGVDPAKITAAQARLAAAQAALEQAYLSVPFDGVISEVTVHPGDQVNANTPAFRLDDTSPMLVSLQVSEIDINKVQIGQTVQLKFDAAPGGQYHARVIEIPMVSQEVAGVVRFIITAEILDADQLIKPGMTTTADIITSTLEDVVLIPNRAIDFIDATRVVYVQRNGQVAPIEVELGPSDGVNTQLLSGDLQPGDRLLIDAPKNFEARAFQQ